MTQQEKLNKKLLAACFMNDIMNVKELLTNPHLKDIIIVLI
jgi:hypothetical protein